jgi:CMP-N-acetylneuraminic acid synthetase
LKNYDAYIFARGGSKGLPGKNIRMFCGKPLIGWAIEHARKVPRIQRVIVSTDCQQIADVSMNFGALVPFLRPIELAGDDSPEWLAWRHALDHMRGLDGKYPDAMVSVPTTSPLRSPEDLENCLNEFDKGGADAVITMTEANRNPFFNMVKRDLDGFVGLILPPNGRVSRRQDAPECYDMATVAYVLDPHFVMSCGSLFEGRMRGVLVPKNRAIDIDSQLDFQIAEILMKSRNENGP